LIGTLSLRLASIAIHWSNLDYLWYDFERRGYRYQVLRVLDLLTFLGFAACAGHALWYVNAGSSGPFEKYAKVFVAWLGASFLAAAPVHRFPRTNDPQLFLDAKIALFVKILLSILGAAAFTAASALWFWLRG
jgi:hypothetical protein